MWTSGCGRPARVGRPRSRQVNRSPAEVCSGQSTQRRRGSTPTWPAGATWLGPRCRSSWPGARRRTPGSGWRPRPGKRSAEGPHAALPTREAALLLGLSIGDTSGMDAEVEEDFRASGLAHLVAVSGANVAMFLVPVLAVAARLGFRLRGRVVIGLGAVAFFALLTRWEP